MTRLRFKTCFISAPLGADTSALRRALEEKSIRWFDQTSLQPGSNWIDAIDKALTKADFVCTVLPESPHSNVFFELGIAYARQKPILAFIGSSIELPTDILSLTYVRTDLKDPATVRSALATFLQHASNKPLRMSTRQVTPTRFQGHTIPKGPTSPPFSATGREFENRTAALLEEAGFILSWPTQMRDRGADFAVWIDETQQSLGNPLLVEVKAGNLSGGRIREAALQLRQHVAKTHGRCAILVYWDRQNREFPAVSTEWPLVFQLSGEALTRLVRQKRLPQQLVRLRNAAVHGEV